jgi:hypothetical protein
VRGSLLISASSASPSISEFETYLEGIEALRAQVPKVRPANMSNDEWWESVLEGEKRRCADDQHSRQVEAGDILLGIDSSDDNVPIVSTLPTAKPKRHVKKKSKVLWTYETVAEPTTGVASKYWDADAPCERGTKKLAKEKENLIALKVANIQCSGPSTCILPFVSFLL